MSVGTEIRYGATMAPDLGWEEELNQGWNREAIVEEGTKLNLKFQVCRSLGEWWTFPSFFICEICSILLELVDDYGLDLAFN